MSWLRAAALAALLTGSALALADAALPSRAAVGACIAEVERSGKLAGEAGPACGKLLAEVVVDGAVPGDTALAENLDKAGEPALRDYRATLPVEAAGLPAGDLEPSQVQAIIGSLAVEITKPKSFWQRAREWLVRLFSKPKAEAGERSPWLEKLFEWLGGIPPAVSRGIGWTLFAVLIGALLWVIVDEIRASTGGRRRKAAVLPPLPADAVSIATPVLSLVEISALPAIERPAALLRWLINALSADGRLPRDAALTNRELQKLLPAEAGASGFGHIAEQAEQSLYGGMVPPADQWTDTLALAQALAQPPPAKIT